MNNCEVLADWQYELLMGNAIHEAGHFIMMFLLTQRAPFYMSISEKNMDGVTIQTVLPRDFKECALILFAGYAAESIYAGNETDKGLGNFMRHDDCDFQMYLEDCRDYSGQQGIAEGFYIFALEAYNAAQQILSKQKSLLFLLAGELMFEREMDYQKIKDFCKEYAQSFPLLATAIFDDFTCSNRMELEESVRAYQLMQVTPVAEAQ